ncbi:MAG: NosD domain-containing protein [Promethearchaeota archaeon]
MRTNRKIKRGVLIIFGIFFTLSPIIDVNLCLITRYSNISLNCNEIFTLDNKNLKTSSISGKIYIDNNWTAAKAAGICTGNGTYSAPYIIEDLVIDAGGSGSGIKIANSTEFFKIENCTLYNSRGLLPWAGLPIEAGILLFNASNGLIIQNNCSYNDIGIFSYGFNNSISSNLITENKWGILSFLFNNITGNNISKNSIGIFSVGYDMILSNIVIKNNYGIYLIEYYGYCTVMQNTVNYNYRAGILLNGSNSNNISKNEINHNKVHGIWITQHFYWWEQPYQNLGYNWISENTINNNTFGITLNYTSNNYVLNNSLNKNELSGINLHESDSNSISYNIISESECGINCNVSIFNEISQNAIKNNFYGISLISSHKNNIVQNTINYNHYGISFTASIRNEIISNVLHYNWMCFIEDQDSYSNNFENNDCIETRAKEKAWIVPLLITTSIITPLIGVAIMIVLYRRYKGTRSEIR